MRHPELKKENLLFSFFVELLMGPPRLSNMKVTIKEFQMQKLEELKYQVNQAYSEALNCPCHKKKKQLMSRFYRSIRTYNQHKTWLNNMSAA